jgi:arsenate reductase
VSRLVGSEMCIRDSTYSGGTEITSFNMNAIQSLHRLGFEINSKEDSLNPIYEVFYDSVKTPINCFSKLYNHSTNPNNNFAAIMTCSDAEENCPFIPEADIRLLTNYSDPKEFDYTSLQDIKYDERCLEIALEIFYVFSLIK